MKEQYLVNLTKTKINSKVYVESNFQMAEFMKVKSKMKRETDLVDRYIVMVAIILEKEKTIYIMGRVL